MEVLNMKKKILKKLIKAYENNHQYNLKHGIVPTDVLIEEVLISDLACIFAKNMDAMEIS